MDSCTKVERYDFDCSKCKRPCRCYKCTGGSEWEWRGENAETKYPTDCDHGYIKNLVARQLADEICNANLVKYEYFDNLPYDPSEMGLVRASIRVVERREDSQWMT